jgi:hypothetical protein
MNQAICLVQAHVSQKLLYIRVLGTAVRDRTTKCFSIGINLRQSGIGDILFLVVQSTTMHQAATLPDRIGEHLKHSLGQCVEKNAEDSLKRVQNDRISRFYMMDIYLEDGRFFADEFD